MEFHVQRIASVDSTNAAVLNLASQGAPEGTVVCADYQTHGRGRRGHHWLSPKGKGLLASLLLRPPGAPDAFAALYELGASSIVAALKTAAGLNSERDGLNDVVSSQKKIAGVLIEGSTTGRAVDWVVLGIGINVNTERHEIFPGATSLFLETKRTYRLDRLLETLLEEIRVRYEALRQEQGAYGL